MPCSINLFHHYFYKKATPVIDTVIIIYYYSNCLRSTKEKSANLDNKYYEICQCNRFYPHQICRV